MAGKKRKTTSRDEDTVECPTSATNGGDIQAPLSGKVDSTLKKRSTLFIDEPLQIFPTLHDRFIAHPKTVGVVGAGFSKLVSIGFMKKARKPRIHDLPHVSSSM